MTIKSYSARRRVRLSATACHRTSRCLKEQCGWERPPDLALQHSLAVRIGLGLKQNRVHIDAGLDTAGPGQDDLRPADVAPAADGGIVAHVLGFERRNAPAAAGKEAAQRRHRQVFAGLTAVRLDHHRPGGHRGPPSTNQWAYDWIPTGSAGAHRPGPL